MDCFNLKRRRKKEREQKFHHLTPHTTPTHSQPSTLSHGHYPADPPRLPKVGSYGLWVGTPGIYASTPSPAYSFGRPGKTHQLMMPAVMQRASSEAGLPQTRGQVYSTGGNQQRIYHSQGIHSPLSPVYELRGDPNNGSVYDVYQIGGGSTTSLLHVNKSFKGDKRLQRSQSDLVADPVRRAYRTKASNAELCASRASSAKDTAASSTTDSSGSPSRQTVATQNQETAQVHQSGGLENPVYIESMEKIVHEDKVAVVASATDSMKLLAKNKTDDQKTVGQSSTSENSASSPESKSPSVPAPASSSLHYSYQGDIYAVPDKQAIRSRSTTSDPSPAQGSLWEKSEENGRVTDPDIAEPVGSLTIDDRQDYDGYSVVQSTVYQEVSYEPSVTHSSIYEEVGEVFRQSQDKTVAGASKTSAVENVREVVSTAGSAVDTVGSHYAPVSDVAAASAVTSERDVGASGETEDPSETAERRHLEQQWSIDTDGTTDELTRAGKHISVTAEAFQFLDTYLSDEDGADINSPPQSPVMTDRSELM